MDEYVPPTQEISHYKKKQALLMGQALSPRQEEIIRMMVEGFKNIQIASALGISSQTVRNHNTDIFAKLGATHRTGAVVLYIQEHPELIRTLVP